jgi:PhoPQ-activated pathogenicity-related protein
MASQRFTGPVLLCVLPLLVAATIRPDAPTVSTQRPPTPGAPLTALDRYVHTPDPAYSWREVSSVEGGDATAHILEMTSQRWLTTNEVNRPLWQHWLTIIRPGQVDHPTALLFIGGGNNNDTRPPRPDGELARVARQTRSVVAQLRMVPNQPLVFGGDGVERVEDDLIAYTWDKFLRTADERWPARLPMTKAAVRAMDTITAFCASETGGGREVNQFVVAGGSKRGWTTWTTAAVDRRVVAICPIVIDVLNMQESTLHHFRGYGFWAPAVGDYVHHGIMEWMRTPEMTALARIEDPYSYRDRLDLPKLIMNACGDQFFLPDSSQFYFSELKGPKYLRYVPNADHSLKETDAIDTLLAFHDAILRGARLPRVTWEHPRPGQVVVRADKPLEAHLWSATATESRDFRLETIGPVWRSTPLQPERGGEYRAEVAAPEKGWTAYMVELIYDIGSPTRIKLTTDLEVIPDTLPFPEPEGRK